MVADHKWHALQVFLAQLDRLDPLETPVHQVGLPYTQTHTSPLFCL